MPGAYSLPQIYDIAFDWRNVPGEVDFLLSAAESYSGRPVRSALELACGPAYHCREMAHRGLASHGIDQSAEMVAYARELATTEKVAAQIQHADMRSYRSSQKYDLVYMLLASFGHLLTNQDILDNFEAVADLLTDNGIYIIATAHPRDFYGENPPPNKCEWSSARDGITVVTDWGGAVNRFDPLTEIDEIDVVYKVTANGRTETHKSTEQLRRCSMGNFLALVRMSGRFELADMLGDFDPEIKLTNDPAAVRFVPILRKITYRRSLRLPLTN